MPDLTEREAVADETILLADQLSHLITQSGKHESPYQAAEDMWPQIAAANSDYRLKRAAYELARKVGGK